LDTGFSKDNNNESYDILLLNVELNISVSDTYTIFASMSPSFISTTDFDKARFDPGMHKVVLELSGTDIYESGRNGPYTIEVSIYRGNGQLVEELDYETKTYDFESFNPIQDEVIDGMESITVVDNTIKLMTNMFVAVIYELTPKIIFYYTSDDGQVARFKVEYNSLICYNDQNSDEKFQDDELVYWGDLISSRWNSPKTLMENFNNFEFSVQTIVDLIDDDNNQIDTKFELVFHYSSLTKASDLETARKFDITFRVLGPPLEGVSHLALTHTLIDEMGNHRFLDAKQEEKISFITNDEKERGYYSWKNFIDVTNNLGQKTKKVVTYNYEVNSDPHLMKLYLSYSYTTDTAEIFHDPKVGVNPDNQPRLPVELDPDIITHNDWFIIYIAVAIIASVIMIGNIYRHKKKRKEY
jgi:hypothetical protein